MTLPVVSVNAIIVDGERRVLLTRRRDVDIWCLPGGLVEQGETVKQAAIREVQEEIGVRCEVVRLVGIYSINNTERVWPAKCNSIILAFRCEISETPICSKEVSEIRFFSPDVLPPIIESHKTRIRDALANFSYPIIS